MELWQALVLGAVEGFTEFLPISSTAHLILAARVLRLPSSEFLKSFEVAVQFGAILSVVLIYFRTFLRNWAANRKVAVAFLPTALIGALLYPLIKRYLLDNAAVSLAALFLGGILLIIFERIHREKPEAHDDIPSLSYAKAAGVGFFQTLAVIPGVSRAAATILGGLLLGMKRKTIVEFSFLLAVPTMAAATGLDLVRSASQFSIGDVHLLIAGFAAAFVVARWSVLFLLRYIQNHDFTAFGWYRIALALVFWAFM